MKILKSILLLVLIYSAYNGYAQDHSAMMVTWKAVQTTNPDNSVVTENTSLVLHGRESLEWKKTTGQIIKSFDVSEIVGTWPLNGDNSEMRFEVVETGKGGYITISKSGNALTAVIVIDYDHPAQYKLILQN